MDNGDMPVRQCFWGDGSSMKSHETQDIHGTNQMLGLTKREAFAMAAMHGIISADLEDAFEARYIATAAVDCADALLKALEEE